MPDLTESEPRQTEFELWLIGWLQKRLGHPVDRSAALFGASLDSLGILEMTAACQEECQLSFSLAELELADLETVGAFAAAVARLAIAGERRVWHEIRVPSLTSEHRMRLLLRLRSQLPEELVLRTADSNDMIKLGVPQNSSWEKNQLASLVEKCVKT
jgi:acyl carrier protein